MEQYVGCECAKLAMFGVMKICVCVLQPQEYWIFWEDFRCDDIPFKRMCATHYNVGLAKDKVTLVHQGCSVSFAVQILVKSSWNILIALEWLQLAI